MVTVPIRVGGRDYRIACDDGQEEHLRVLADDVDDRVRSLAFSTGNNLSENMALLMSALTMADELIELRKENERLRQNGLRMPSLGEDRVREIEVAMAATLDEIASRIEKIAEASEIR